MSRRAWLRAAKKWPENWRPLPTGVPRFPHPLPIHLAHVAQWFHALSDIRRLHILESLTQRDRSVTELEQVSEIPHSSMIFHLKVLKESGLIEEYRDGRLKYYSIREETLDHLAALTRKLGPGQHRGTCPLDGCREGVLTYQENLIRYGP